MLLIGCHCQKCQVRRQFYFIAYNYCICEVLKTHKEKNNNEFFPILEIMKEQKERRFKVGDKVTYKKREDCVKRDGGNGYYHTGSDQGGYVGTVIKVGDFNAKMDCYNISVSIQGGVTYVMLESEFVEYGLVANNEFFPLY